MLKLMSCAALMIVATSAPTGIDVELNKTDITRGEILVGCPCPDGQRFPQCCRSTSNIEPQNCRCPGDPECCPYPKTDKHDLTNAVDAGCYCPDGGTSIRCCPSAIHDVITLKLNMKGAEQSGCPCPGDGPNTMVCCHLTPSLNGMNDGNNLMAETKNANKFAPPKDSLLPCPCGNDQFGRWCCPTKEAEIVSNNMAVITHIPKHSPFDQKLQPKDIAKEEKELSIKSEVRPIKTADGLKKDASVYCCDCVNEVCRYASMCCPGQ